jgi:AcrR family transcriptional regulator
MTLTPRSTVAEIQRERIIRAVVAVVAERGIAGATVKLVTARAKVSRRTFYECFDGLDECLMAIMDGALEHFGVLVSRGFAGEDSWNDGMRKTLAGVLVFFDLEPALAQVFIVEALGAASAVREHRERVIEAMRLLLVARIEGEVVHASPLEPEGVLASVMGIIHARLVGSERRPLIELLGPLMGIVVGPFMKRAQVLREVEEGDRLAQAIMTERAQLPTPGPDEAELGLVEIPAMLSNARAERARSCVLYLATQGARGLSPSNREIAAAIGIANEGQISKLLIRLERGAVVSKFSHGAGRPNAWRLTPYGEEIATQLKR